MAVLKQMINKSNNLLHEQGEQLRVGGEAISRAKANIKAGKDDVIDAAQYSVDSNKMSIYCCILVFIIVIIILMIYYAASK